MSAAATDSSPHHDRSKDASASDQTGIDAATRDAGIRWTARHAHEGSAFFRDLIDASGIRPDDITGAADLHRLPFTTKEHLREHGPWGLTAVPMADVVRMHSSSGTTGRRTICTYTQPDLDAWTQQFARCYSYAGVSHDDRVQIAVGYGLWTAGVGFQAGAEAVGAMSVPTGPGNTDLQLEAILELKTTVLGATASFALLLAELIDQRGLRDEAALRVGIFGSERWGEATRRRIDQTLGIESFDIYGLTELWGPGTGIECHLHNGIHVWSDHYHVEVVDPETLEPVPEGQPGELVLTTLGKQATPLLRYRTRDMSSLLPGPCDCGSPHPRIARLTGRTDDACKIRGVLVVPAQVDIVLGPMHDHTSGEFQLHVDRDERGRDIATVRVETSHPAPATFAEEVAARLRDHIGVRIDVEPVGIGTLGRSERKTARLFDHRDP